MKKYPALLAAFYSNPWLLSREKFEEIRGFLQLKGAGGKVSAEEIKALAARRRDDSVQMAGRIAILPVMGVISQRMSGLEAASGGESAEQIGQTLDSLVADKQVKTIVMQFDSPGGSVFGIEELGRKIMAARSDKRIVGIADSVAASAAYWLLAQTSEINVTPGGQVGSIGVISAHEDYSKFEEKAGVKTTLVTSSKFKAEGNPYEPLNDDARAEMTRKVQAYHTMFTAAVARGRGITEARVEKDFGQGRMLMAKEAVAAGMADRVATLEQVIQRLGGSSGGPAARLSARARLAEVE